MQYACKTKGNATKRRRESERTGEEGAAETKGGTSSISILVRRDFIHGGAGRRET